MTKLFSPPPEIVQRYRCYLALRALRTYVDIIGPTHQPAFDAAVERIRNWLKACEDMLDRKPVSNKTDSDVIDQLRIIVEAFPCKAGTDQSKSEEWAAGMSCAHALMIDVRATCPNWYSMPVRKKNNEGRITNRYPWRYLYKIVEEFADNIQTNLPQAFDKGFEVYMVLR